MWKNEVKKEVLDVKGYHGPVPFAWITVDFYNNHHNKIQFAVCRISWINPRKSALVAHNLGALALNPSCSDRKSEKSSDLLIKFSEKLRHEHAVSRNDLLVVSTHYGPNVRRACSCVSRSAEWCFGHLAVRASVEAFETSKVASQSKNIQCCVFFSKVKKAAEPQNKSSTLIKMF